MRLSVSFSALLACVTLAPAAHAFGVEVTPPVDGFTPAAPVPEQVVPGRVLLRLAAPPVASADILARVAARSGVRATLGREMHFGWGLYELDGALTEADTLAAIARLTADPEVSAAAPDRWLRPLARPVDEHLDLVWPHTLNSAEAAWDLTVGLETQRIGVVDTGTNLHEDLDDKDAGGYDFITDVDRGADGDGRDADYSDPGGITECNGQPLNLLTHGTHVAGILLAEADNGVGTAGVNWNAQLVTARTLNQCGGAESDTLDALAWMAGFPVPGAGTIDEPLTLANLSLGSAGECSAIFQDYVDFLRAETNFLLVAATGNESLRDEIFSPSNCEGVIAVSAHGPDHELAPYANFLREETDIVGPGGNMFTGQEDGVLSACGEGPDCYQYGQGTSMATPYVTGAISLMLALTPDLTHEQIVDILRSTGVACEGCDDVPALQLDAALAAAQAASGTPFEPPFHQECPTSPCDPSGFCPDGFGCFLDDAQLPCCFATCEVPFRQDDCSGDLVCLPADAETNICKDVGILLNEGADCGDGVEGLCRPGTICGGITEGQLICLQRCDEDFVCRSSEQSCQDAGDFSVCIQPLDPTVSDAPITCDVARGNFDCADGWACVDGNCVLGAEGELDVGLQCAAGAECTSGLCVTGVCTVPCDEGGGCHAGTSCDLEAAPGGICAPLDCSGDATVCSDPFSCVDGTCAIASGCACDQTDSPQGFTLLSALLLAFGAWRRRRR